MLTTISKEVSLSPSEKTAFQAFTVGMDHWWPRSHPVVKCSMVEQVLEQEPGGRWSRREDGGKVNFGCVFNWEPFQRLALVWQIDGHFQCRPDVVTEAELNFLVEGPEKTHITLDHRDLQMLSGGTKVVERMNEDWEPIMNLYKGVGDVL